MIPSAFYWTVGYRVLSAPPAYAAALLELCRRFEMVYDDFGYTDDGGISLRMPLPAARRLEVLCVQAGIPVSRGTGGGLPFLARRLWGRAGLVVGLILGVLLLLGAQSVVWDIRISGNEQVSDRSIEETLAACGFGVGTSLRGFEADKLENDVLMRDGRLAWISVNRKGTVAYVEVREKVPRPDEGAKEPCDIVAAHSGVIQRVELEAGNVRVAAGQTVDAGEVLVSGLYDSEQMGIRFTAAKARVFARTHRVLTVTIPLSYEQKVYAIPGDGGEHTTKSGICQEKIVNFFGNHIKFSKKTGNPGAFCDTIESEKVYGLAGGVGFPISLRTVWYMPYTVTTATRTLQEAEELAYYELARRIAALPGGAELISKTITVHHGSDALTLTCTLTCIEDIGCVRPIEIVN